MKLLIAIFLTVLTQVGGCLLFYWGISDYFTTEILLSLIGRDLYYTALPTIFLTLLVQYLSVLFGAHLLARAKRAETRAFQNQIEIDGLQASNSKLYAELNMQLAAKVVPIKK